MVRVLFVTIDFRIWKMQRIETETMRILNRFLCRYPHPKGAASSWKALLDKYPDYVVKRYESGGVATNAECDAIYRQALEKLGDNSRSVSGPHRFRDTPLPPLPRTQPRVDVPRYPTSPETARQPFTGMKGNPVHVVVDEGLKNSLTQN